MLTWLRSNILFLIPIAAMLIFYTVQEIAGLELLKASYVIQFAAISIIWVAVYFTVYIKMPADRVRKIVPLRLNRESFKVFANVIVITYVAILFLAIATADHVPIFSALSGAISSDLTEYRETFLRTRTGMGQGLNYLYVIFNNSLMPLAVCYAFWARKKVRFVVLAIFVFGLSLTLQKGAIASAGLPLFFLFAMEGRYKRAGITVVGMVAVVAAMYVMASGRLSHVVPEKAGDSIGETIPGGDAKAPEIDSPKMEQVENVSAVPEEYNITGRTDQISLLMNRILWIPYITAIDWIRYQDERLGGEMVLGRSIGPFAAITGQTPINMEREVATMQWGQNAQGTASSNAHFSVDAWVNFGFLGVVLYAALFAFTIKVISTTGFLPLISASVVPVYTAQFVGLPPVFLSGGLGLILAIALLLSDRSVNALRD